MRAPDHKSARHRENGTGRERDEGLGDPPHADSTRRFSRTERSALWLAAEGCCQHCGTELEPGWHADHVIPWVAGGSTDVTNGQALCADCNLAKGARMTRPLRAWQSRAKRDFFALGKRVFLQCATPAAGKTDWALDLATTLRGSNTVERVVVVVPTDPLRLQWADRANEFGLHLVPVAVPEDYDKAGYDGCVVTYQQLATGAGADLMRRAIRQPTVVFLDEAHHMGDERRWGTGAKHAFEHAQSIVGLTGTPWRDINSPIPFFEYDDEAMVVVDNSYEYGEAVQDEVCRRVEFHAYDGEARWVDCGEVMSSGITETSDDDEGIVLQTVLDHRQPWIPTLLQQAVDSLTEARQTVPDAGGLVVAYRRDRADQYADLLAKITGRRPPVADSLDPHAKRVIDQFRAGREPWLVAVKMVSEGVDIPRLVVGVYATQTRTPMFFRQVVGRFVRVRPGEEINARLFIPAIPTLMAHAKAIEDELRHQLDMETERPERFVDDRDQVELALREPLSASDATFGQVVYGGEPLPAEAFAEAEEDCRLDGIPLKYAPNIARHNARKATAAPAPTEPTTAPPLHRQEKLLRGEITTLVGKLSYRLGISPEEVNKEIRRANFPKRAAADFEQLQAIHAWLVQRYDGGVLA